LEYLDVNGRTILKWALKKRNGTVWLDAPGSGKGQVTGCFEHGNEPSGSTKRGELDQLRKYCLFTDSAPWS